MGGTTMTAKELKLDYFQIYDVANRQSTGNVLLQGQFDARLLRMELALLDFFANPVAKNAEPIYDKNAHLTWYRGSSAAGADAGSDPRKPVRQVRNPHGDRLRIARPDPESRIGECVPQDTRSLQRVSISGRREGSQCHPQAAGSNSAPMRHD